MKDGRHMLSGEEGTASSPRFKSKRRSEGPDIFKGVKERRGRTNRDLRSARRYKQKFKCALKRTACLYKKSALDGISEIEEASSEFEEANSKIEEVLAFSKAGLARKPRANLPFQTCPHSSHATSTLDEAQKSERHLAFPDALAPVTRKLSFAKITGNLLKRQSQISKRRQSFQPHQHPSRANSALRKSRVICRSADPNYRRGASLFQPRQHSSHAHSAWRKLRTICRKFLIKKQAREAV
ncbi:hypothetical protein ACFXTH_030695 [Malus domestica]